MTRSKAVASLVISTSFLVLMVGALLLSLQFKAVSAWFPLFVSISGSTLSLIAVIVDIYALRKRASGDLDQTQEEEEADPISASTLRGLLRHVSWLVGFGLALFLFGAPLAIAGWLAAFVRFESRESWLRVILSALVACGVVIAFSAAFGLALPRGALIPSSSWIPRWTF